MSGDRGDIVMGWLVRISIGLTLFSIVVFDAVSVGVAIVGAQDDSTQAALAASESWHSTHNVDRAYAAAVDYADARGATVDPKSFRVDDEGRVRLSVRKTATTLVLYRIGPLKKLAEVTESGEARAVPGT